MKNDFATRAMNSSIPMIRQIDAYMQADPTFLSFAEGNPAVEALDVEAIADIAHKCIKEDPGKILLYSNGSGDDELKELIKQRLEKVKGIPTEGNEVLIEVGGQQGLYLVPRIFINPGDTFLAEEITYAGMLDTVADFEGHATAVKVDDDGINLEDLEKKLQETPRVKYIYLIPNFNNPTGVTLPWEKRQAVYQLACKYDTMIVEDDPYGDLRYEGESVPPIKSLDKEGRVIYLGTFSKTIAAGLRVGFMLAPTAVYEKAAANKASIDSNTPMLCQEICIQYMRDYDFEGNILKMRDIYKEKWQAARDALKKYLPADWKILDAKGGMFFFVRPPEDKPHNEKEFMDACIANKVGFVPGSAFAADAANPAKGYRICFTPMTPEQITEGCRRFGEVAASYVAK